MLSPGPVAIVCAMKEEAQPFLAALEASTRADTLAPSSSPRTHDLGSSQPTVAQVESSGTPSTISKNSSRRETHPPALPDGFQGPTTFTAGVLQGHQVIVATTGIGMTNSALALTTLALTCRPRLVIFAGTTGGLGVNVRLEDVIVAEAALYHDADARVFGYAPGQIPQMPPQYAAESSLNSVAREALHTRGIRFHSGQVSASNSFVSGDLVGPVRALFPEVVAVDMETTAGAQVCWEFSIPWVGLRAVSDLCEFPEEGSAPNQFARSFEAVEAFLGALPVTE